MNMLIPDLAHDQPANTMKELLKCRHLAPIYGKKTQIAPTSKDWMIIDKVPDIFQRILHRFFSALHRQQQGDVPEL